MDIISGSTTNKIGFVAFATADGSRMTGLSSFTVYRSRNGGTATAYTTPTVAELDATNMPGEYVLTLDEDTTVTAGTTEEYHVSISATGMERVTRTVMIDGRTHLTTSDVWGTSVPGSFTSGQAGYVLSQAAAIASSSGTALRATVIDDNASGTNPLNGVTFVGVLTSGTFANLVSATGVHFVLDDTSNQIDYVCKVTIPPNAIPLSAEVIAYLISGNDTCVIQAYDFVAAGWETRATILGTASSTDQVLEVPLGENRFSSSGTVYLRFHSATGSNQTLGLDAIGVTYINQTVGYVDGAVWLDTVDGTAGTTPFVHGVADLTTNTLANAITIATELNLRRLHLISGSSITLTSAFPYHILGDNYTLALGGQDIAGAIFEKFGPVSGIATGSGTPPVFNGGPIGNVTLPPCVILNAGFTGTLTVGSAGDYLLADCHSQVAGSGTPVIDFGAIGSTNMSIRRWSGGLTLNNVAAGDTISVDAVSGGTASIDGTGGTVHVRGMIKVVDNSSGAVTIVQTQALNRETISDAVWDEVVDGTTTGRESIRLANSALGGKASGLDTTTAIYRDLADSKDRISATVDTNGNRTAVTRDLS